MTEAEQTELAELVTIYEAALTIGVARQLAVMQKTMATVASQRDQWQRESARHKQEISALRKQLGR